MQEAHSSEFKLEFTSAKNCVNYFFIVAAQSEGLLVNFLFLEVTTLSLALVVQHVVAIYVFIYMIIQLIE